MESCLVRPWLMGVLLVRLVEARMCGLAEIFPNHVEGDPSGEWEQGLGVPNDCVTLSIQGASLGDAGAVAVADALGRGGAGGRASERRRASANLRNLYLSNNSIGARGTAAIAARLSAPAAPQITSLHMWKNTMGSSGAQAMAKLLTEQRDGPLYASPPLFCTFAPSTLLSAACCLLPIPCAVLIHLSSQPNFVVCVCVCVCVQRGIGH
jgi:hypothetical protein